MRSRCGCGEARGAEDSIDSKVEVADRVIPIYPQGHTDISTMCARDMDILT